MPASKVLPNDRSDRKANGNDRKKHCLHHADSNSETCLGRSAELQNNSVNYYDVNSH